MDIKIALAGNPNCGKTTLFNALTGSNQYVGNWPGVTVEKKEGKYRKDTHPARFQIIAENWDRILQIMDEELPSSEELVRLMDTIEAPKTFDEVGIDSTDLPLYFKATKDIRDKYVLSRLAWDLGVIDEIVEGVK